MSQSDFDQNLRQVKKPKKKSPKPRKKEVHRCTHCDKEFRSARLTSMFVDGEFCVGCIKYIRGK